MNLWKLTNNKYLKARIVVIYALSGLLIVYHLSKIFSMYWGPDSAVTTALLHAQSGIRLAIVISLAGVLLGFKNSLWGMWLTIAALIATNYILLWNNKAAVDIEMSVYLSYLRGFISPMIITLLYPSTKT